MNKATASSPVPSEPPADTGRIYGGESLAERRARRRQQFLDAGLDVFGTTGYRTATVRQLCRQAELTDRYFYESFDGIEDLLMAVYTWQFSLIQRDVRAVLEAQAAPTDPLAAAHAALDALYARAEDPRVARVCWLEVLGVSPRVDQMYNATFEGFSALTIAFARRVRPDWQLEPEETRMLGMAVVGAVSQTVTYWVMGGHKEQRTSLVAATARVFQGVLSTL